MFTVIAWRCVAPCIYVCLNPGCESTHSTTAVFNAGYVAITSFQLILINCLRLLPLSDCAYSNQWQSFRNVKMAKLTVFLMIKPIMVQNIYIRIRIHTHARTGRAHTLYRQVRRLSARSLQKICRLGIQEGRVHREVTGVTGW